MRSRQRHLGVPESFEWVDETTPALRPVMHAAGMSVQRYPLLVLHGDAGAPDLHPTSCVRLMSVDDPDLGAVDAAIGASFGPSDAEPPTAQDSTTLPALRRRMARGETVVVGAFVDGRPVGGGMHNPRIGVSEIVGVGVLGAHRGQGLGAAVTATLARDAAAHGAVVVFCSAGSHDVARIYERIGFRRTAHACIANPHPQPQEP